MVLPNITCTLVEVDDDTSWAAQPAAPRDLLPWADPYIASLLGKLHRELMDQDHLERSPARLRGEMQPPYPQPGLDFEGTNDDDWSRYDFGR